MRIPAMAHNAVGACALTMASLSEPKERAVRNNDRHCAFFRRITTGPPMISQTLMVRIVIFFAVHVGMFVWLLAFL
jgi:hypothetical protein